MKTPIAEEKKIIEDAIKYYEDLKDRFMVAELKQELKDLENCNVI